MFRQQDATKEVEAGQEMKTNDCFAENAKLNQKAGKDVTKVQKNGIEWQS